MTGPPSNIIIYNTADGKAPVALYALDGKMWLDQQLMAALGLPPCFQRTFATSKQTVSYHIAIMHKEKELLEAAVVK